VDLGAVALPGRTAVVLGCAWWQWWGGEHVREFIDPSLTQLMLWKYLPWWWFRFKERANKEMRNDLPARSPG
jgi:hypothetical protein